MKLIFSISVVLLSSFLVATGVYLGIDAMRVAAFGHNPMSHGGTEAWQLALAALTLSHLGGSIAGFANSLLYTNEP